MPRRTYRRTIATPILTSTSASEQALLRRTFLNITGRFSARQKEFVAASLVEYIVDHAWALGLDVGTYSPEFVNRSLESEFNNTRLLVLEAMLEELAALPSARRSTALDRRIDWIIQTLALDAVEAAILTVLARITVFEPWEHLTRILPSKDHHVTSQMLAALTGRSPLAVENRVLTGARLVRTGLIERGREGSLSTGAFLNRVAKMHNSVAAALTAHMLPPACRSSLEWDDFSHLGILRDFASEAIAKAARKNTGVNVLFHGLAGTGKSELACVLADRLGLSAIFVGLCDEDGDEPGRSERLAHLNIVRALTRKSRNHVIVVDEADDVCNASAEDRFDRRSKLWLNRLVEQVETPTIWITNDASALGETIVRRMHLAIEFDLPPASVRAQIVKRAAAKAKLSLDEHAVAAVAQLPAAPAVLANAVATARLASGDGATIRQAGQSILTALGLPMPDVVPLPSVYDPALAEADQDLVCLANRLVDGIRNGHASGFNLLLVGPPGTGKSAWARHMAERLNIEVDEKRGSDLLNPYVGGTETQIARAFRQSADRGTMLLIDEADSFLLDRRNAKRSWESSMVNEMLRWMDHHPAPFIATTNLADTLDPATQRRFTLTIRFRALTSERAAALFVRVFGAQLPGDARPLEGVTPGDIGVVAKRARLLAENDPKRLADWVRAEVDARGGKTAKVGFHASA